MNIKSLFIVILLVLIASTGFADTFYVPPYYQQSNYLMSTPSVSGDAAGANLNPAVHGLSENPELQFFWNDMLATSSTLKNWSLLTSLGHLGFGMQHWDYPGLIQGVPGRAELYDYHLGLGFGDQAQCFGLGYTWSKGDMSLVQPRDNVLSAGFIGRPNRYLTYGLAGHYALNNNDLNGILDFGFRPLGTKMFTVFGDMSLQNDQKFEDLQWSAGISVEPIAGLNLFGKYFDNETFTAGLSITFGSSTTSLMQRFDKDANLSYSTYGVRVGMPQPDAFTPLAMKDRMYLRLDFTGPVKYQRYKLFDHQGHTLMELLTTLDQAKNDQRIGGLAIKITEDMSGSWELIWEVRQKILEVRKAGKQVYVFFERGGMKQYYLASAGDKIMADPETGVMMIGFNLGRTYYKNLLEKAGLGFDEWRFFKYKSALEGFAREDMSEADREQRKALVDGWYEIYRADVCAQRPLNEQEFDHIINEVGVLNADSLLTYQMIDTTGRWEDFTDWIKDSEGHKKIINQKTFTLLQPESDEWGIAPQIAVIYALGPCAMNYGINARRLRGVIKAAREDQNIKAVVLRADSPGGDVLPSDIVAEELRKTSEKKPVIVSQGFVAASGGYWISMYGDKIVASPWTITGSIGVIGGWIYDNGFGDKVGLNYDYVKRGEHADFTGGMTLPLLGAQIPDRPLSEWERGMMERMIRGHYQNFLEKVGQGRKLEVEEVHKIAQGRVWTGTDGLKLKLVDELGGLTESLEFARQAAGIRPDRRYEVTEMPNLGMFNPGMFGKPSLLGIQWRNRHLSPDNPQLDYMRLMLEAEGRPLILLPPEYYIH